MSCSVVKAFRKMFDYDNEVIAYPKVNFHTKKKEHKSEFVFISLFEIGLNLILTPHSSTQVACFPPSRIWL